MYLWAIYHHLAQFLYIPCVNWFWVSEACSKEQRNLAKIGQLNDSYWAEPLKRTPIWFVSMLGSGEMTVLPAKFTLLPIIF